ncbi:MAG: hypothetical protein AAF668_01890 [Pseudomonadota bacterium]
MSGGYKYIMLMASLPAPGPLFTEKQPPLSRLRVENRLRQLDEDDLIALQAIEDALEWRHVGADSDDADVLERVRRAESMTTSETLRSVIKSRMDVRTCLAGLRRRAAGGEAPPTDGSWGLGRLGRTIGRNWRAAAFGLERSHPWIKDADHLVTEGDAYGLERLILETVDRDLRRRGALHQFDLEAVVIYVLRWSLIDRWSRYNTEGASRRFARLLSDVLGSAAGLSARGRNHQEALI